MLEFSSQNLPHRISKKQQSLLLLGRLSLDVDPSLEVRAVINGDALGCDVPP